MRTRVSNVEMVDTYKEMLLRNRAMTYRTQDKYHSITIDSSIECECMARRNDKKVTKMAHNALRRDNNKLFNECANV